MVGGVWYDIARVNVCVRTSFVYTFFVSFNAQVRKVLVKKFSKEVCFVYTYQICTSDYAAVWNMEIVKTEKEQT